MPAVITEGPQRALESCDGSHTEPGTACVAWVLAEVYQRLTVKPDENGFISVDDLDYNLVVREAWEAVAEELT